MAFNPADPFGLKANPYEQPRRRPASPPPMMGEVQPSQPSSSSPTGFGKAATVGSFVQGFTGVMKPYLESTDPDSPDGLTRGQMIGKALMDWATPRQAMEVSPLGNTGAIDNELLQPFDAPSLEIPDMRMDFDFDLDWT